MLDASEQWREKYGNISCRCDNKRLIHLISIYMFPPHYRNTAPLLHTFPAKHDARENWVFYNVVFWHKSCGDCAVNTENNGSDIKSDNALCRCWGWENEHTTWQRLKALHFSQEQKMDKEKRGWTEMYRSGWFDSFFLFFF